VSVAAHLVTLLSGLADLYIYSLTRGEASTASSCRESRAGGSPGPGLIATGFLHVCGGVGPEICGGVELYGGAGGGCLGV